MTRIVVVGASPLMSEGAAAALRRTAVDASAADADDGWQVRVGSARDPADAWVMLGDEITVRGAQGGGAQLRADAGAERLRAAVAAVLAGLTVRDIAWTPPAPEGEPLTPRELEVFELLGKGLSNRDIGQVLGISMHTAKYHVGQILTKVGATTRAEAVAEGLRQGWIGL